ncbi:sensor histidine kinase [uncultured Jatrophihabitans sp.]|uniref:sensor histidine kinase n=1 Tax=uncultured Jatrophihabitans sp. TaxID=1610747 RepID=UPI0035CAC44D
MRLPAVPTRLRGIRARLVAVYVLVALALAAVGFTAFVYLLDNALHQSVNSDLTASASAVAADVTSGRVARSSQAPEIDGARFTLSTITAVYDPSGTLIDAQPSRLPADPSTLAKHPGYISLDYGGKPFRFLRRTVHAQGGRWTVIVGQSLATANDAKGDAKHALYVIVPIAIVLSGLGAWLLSGAALRPVDRMRADAQQLSETEAPGEIGTPGTSDSLDRLATTFNVLLTRLHSSLDRQRDLVADAGHELRTPLAVLQTELETADRPGRSREDLAESIRYARAETARLATLSEDLLLLAQADGPSRIVHPELVEPADVAAGSIAALRDEATAAGVFVELDTAGTPAVAVLDPVALRRVLDNLLTNAVRHTPAGGAVHVRVAHVGDDLEILVEDTGSGFPDDFLPHAFERFSRAERSRSRSHARYGSGLGLSIVETLVVAHGGTVTAANRPSGGARLTVRLPRRLPE